MPVDPTLPDRGEQDTHPARAPGGAGPPSDERSGHPSAAGAPGAGATVTCPGQAAPPAAGSIPIPAVPGYEVLELIGQGGMGVVYRARQVSTNRTVALKMILAGELASPADRDRFQAEAEATAKLSHPHIVQLYEAGEAGGRLFLSCEYVPGGSLAAALDGTPWDARRAARLVVLLARAIQHAHDHGIVHRDLKPANVLIAGAGGHESGVGTDRSPAPPSLTPDPWAVTPKVADFGLAKQLGGDADGPTVTGAVLGTPSYMAPEQAGGAKAAGPAADVYALGAILYELLTGRRPFTGADVLAVLDQVRKTEPVPPRALQPRLPRDIETVCLKCLQKDPARRYPSAGALADDLERFLDGRPIVARPVGSIEWAWRLARRNPLDAALIAAVVVLLVAGAAVAGVLAVRANRYAADADLRRDEAERAERNERARADGEAAAKRDAERELSRAEWLLYASRVTLAHRAWDAGDVALSRHYLDLGRPDFRGWEYRYLRALPGRSHRVLGTHADVVGCVAYRPDGSTLATGSRDRTVKLWDVAAGKERLTLTGHAGHVECLAFSPDGALLASGSDDTTVRVWDVAAGTVRFTLTGHTNTLTTVAFSPDGKYLVSGGADPVLRVWDATRGTFLRRLSGHTGTVVQVWFDRDGKRLTSVDAGGARKVWDPATWQEQPSLGGKTEGSLRAAFTPDGRRMAVITYAGTLALHDLDRPGDRRLLSGHGGAYIHALAFRPDGLRVVTAGMDGLLKVWDTATGQEVRTLKGHTGSVEEVAFSPDGRAIASVGTDRTVRVWDPDRDQAAAHLGPPDAFNTLAVSPDGSRVAAGYGSWSEDDQGNPQTVTDSGVLRVLDAATGEVVLTPQERCEPVFGVVYSPDGARLAACGAGGAVTIRDAATGKEVRALASPHRAARSVAFSPDGSRLVSAGHEGTVVLWDATTGEAARTWKRDGWPVRCLAFSPDGRYLAAGGGNPAGRNAATVPEVVVWDARTGDEVRTLGGHGGAVYGLAFSPDGSRLAAGGADGVVRVWDPATGRELVTARGHTGAVRSVTFTPDGSRVVSGSLDETVKVWEAARGQELLTLTGHAGVVVGVAFTPDGRRLVTGSALQPLKVWEAGP